MPANSLYLSLSLRKIEARHQADRLMSRAGQAAAEWAAELAGEGNLPVLILAGPGNNGGDAFETARLLRERFFAVEVLFAGEPEGLPDDARAAHQAFVAAGGTTSASISHAAYGLIIDGLFGIGLGRPPTGRYAEWIASANQLARHSGCPLLALDCPSGLDVDSGQCLGPTIQASHTLSLIAAKPGLYTGDGPDYCGTIRIAELGLSLADEPAADGRLISLADFASDLRPRHKNTHKGSYGSAGILGGAPSMVGAAFLSGRAAIKLGAGRVYVGLLDHQSTNFDPVQPELMLRRPQALLQAGLDALACGPGLGISLEASELLETAIAFDQPLVIDADALNLVSSEGNLQVALASRKMPAILTPHPTEASRLIECGTPEIQADRLGAAREISERYRCHVALKGCGTLVYLADGRWFINPTGNPGMATAGMGDVLTGLILALLAQGWSSEQALLAGVHLHGAAADRLVAAGIGPIGLTAGEVIDAARALFNAWIVQRSGG